MGVIFQVFVNNDFPLAEARLCKAPIKIIKPIWILERLLRPGEKSSRITIAGTLTSVHD